MDEDFKNGIYISKTHTEPYGMAHMNRAFQPDDQGVTNTPTISDPEFVLVSVTPTDNGQKALDDKNHEVKEETNDSAPNANVREDCQKNPKQIYLEADEDIVFENEDYEPNCYNRCMGTLQAPCHKCYKAHRLTIRRIVGVVILLLYIAYFAYSIYYNAQGAIPLIAITCFVVLVVVLVSVKRIFGSRINEKCCVPFGRIVSKVWRYLRWVVLLAILIGLVLFIVFDVSKDMRRLMSLSGIVFFILMGFIFSKNQARINWQPVIWGLVLQLTMGFIVLRWSVGYTVVNWVADQAILFLDYTKEGTRFVFGDTSKHPFAFESLPVVIYFSAIVSILYYWGIMQGLIKGMAWLMQITMGTTALESLATASNIFISYVEVAPILLPYFHKLTKSELHAILTGGFATVAGSILAIYISFGAPANHLISACLMSAPAALAMAKLSFPETKKSKTRTQKDVELPKPTERSVMEAAANGAMIAIKLVAGIAACIIAFLGIVGFINASLSWLGARAGYPQINFQFICSYLFWPVTVMMGVDIADAREVARMLGLKIFVDDVLCYQNLGQALKAGKISVRSGVITTYACCGFGSLGALGVALGAMLAIAPRNRRSTLVQVVPRALINGNMAAFMTACVAGLLYQTDTGSTGVTTAASYNATFTPITVGP